MMHWFTRRQASVAPAPAPAVDPIAADIDRRLAERRAARPSRQAEARLRESKKAHDRFINDRLVKARP
jgi:hypothetical protein